MEVFFDDFSVHLTGTDIVQKDDYYPFGGSFNAYTDLSTPQQDYLYNGVRLNKTTQLYETAFRTYDPYLGRFNHIDPLTAMVPGLSPYHFGFNNPVRYSDPMGLMGDDAGIWGTGNTYGSSYSQNPFSYLPGARGGFTGPGSGHHWADGWEKSHWNAWTGSDSYREEKAFAKSIGGYGYGGSFFDGGGNEIGFVNGKYQVWYPKGGDLAYTVEGDGFVDLHYYGAWGDPVGLGNQNFHSSVVFANSFFAADVTMYLIDVYSDYSLAVNEGIRQGYRKALGGYSWTPGTLKNSNELFKGLKAATGALGKVSFGVGAGISLINMANNPTLENFAWGFADIGVGAIGLYSGAIAATLTTAGLAVPGLNLIIAGAALGYAGYRIYSNWE